ncbi:MAG: hypothetical protein ACRDNZ_00360 [Streptosporangiaceae bacterium]
MSAAETPDGIVPAARRGEHVVVTRFRLAWPRRGSGGWLLAGAIVLLAGLAGAQGYVSWHAQVVFIEAQKHHQHAASVLEAFGLDAGAVIFALLGIALARLGRRAAIERAGVVLCSAGSAVMNLLGADLGSPRSVVVYVMPALLFAATADRLVAVVRRAALGPVADSDGQGSMWHAAGAAALYALRFLVAPPSTAAGARRALLNATPLPARGPALVVPRMAIEPPHEDGPDDEPKSAASEGRGGDERQVPPRDGSKTAAFLARVEEQQGPLASVDLEKVGRICADLHGDLDEGAARTALRKAVIQARTGRDLPDLDPDVGGSLRAALSLAPGESDVLACEPKDLDGAP